MVLLTTTPQILDLASFLSSSDCHELDTTLLPKDLSSPISHSTLVDLARLSEKYSEHGKYVSLNGLLRGTRPYIAPPPPRTEPSAQYVALMAKLRREQEQREYHHIVSQQRQSVGDVEEDEDQDNISPSLVLNILLSIVMCAFAIFHVTRFWRNDGLRVLVSLGVGLVVGVAEVTVYAAYLRKVKEGKRKERKKKEKKSFVAEYTGQNPASIDRDGNIVMLDGEKEEIWGKGKHGGMRRRVREKWEREQEKT